MDKKEIDNEVDRLITIELENCTSDVYPTLCKMKSTEMGLVKIRKMVREILIETPMDIGSALAQIDSSY